MPDLKNILNHYIIAGLDPYFSQGHRRNLRYAAKDYLYASLMEINPRGIDPVDYLYFAKADLLSNDLRGAINALCNAKRSLHLLIDAFLEIIGIKKIYEKDNFPNKLKVIEDLEAFPVRLIKNLNAKRNIIEHEFDRIEIAEAQEFVEIAEIFLRLCYPYLKKTIIGTRIGVKNDDKDIAWDLNPKNSTVTINECHGAEKIKTEEFGTIYYNFPEKEEKKLINQIEIRKSNVDEWVPIINTLLYCTQKGLIAELPPYDEKDHERIMMFINRRHIL